MGFASKSRENGFCGFKFFWYLFKNPTLLAPGDKESHAKLAFLEVINMEAQEDRPATERQKKFIQDLARQKNIELDTSLESMDMPTASRIINRLISPEDETEIHEPRPANTMAKQRIDNVKLGMAMKLVYNNWKYNVNAICSDGGLRNLFKGQVLETYGILREIEEKALEIFGGDRNG